MRIVRAWMVRDKGALASVLEFVDVDDPVPGAGDVVVDVTAASVGFPDLLQVTGRYQTIPPLPFVPGREFVGVVSAVGADVSAFSPGDRVLSITGGGLAERAIVPAAFALPVPDAFDDVVASAVLVNYGTAIVALENRARLRRGETLLVTAAAGGVGIAAVQVGRALGAHVIGVAGGAAHVAAAVDAGAEVAFDYRAGPFVDAVRDATSGHGVDVCFDAVGGDIFDGASRVMAWDGRLLVVGFASGEIPTAELNRLILQGCSYVGVNAEVSAARDPGLLVRIWDRIVTWHASGAVRPVIGSVRPLDEALVTFEELAARRVVGKAVLVRDVDGSAPRSAVNALPSDLAL